jgi:hypothetical protein
MLALSNLTALLVSFAFVVNAAPSVGPSPDLGSVYAVYPGWDMDNGGFQGILGGTEFACLQACHSSGFPERLVLFTRLT